MNFLRGNNRLTAQLMEMYEKILIDYQTDPAISPFTIVTLLPIVAFIIDQTLPPLPIFGRVFSRGVVPLVANSFCRLFNGTMRHLIEYFTDDDAGKAYQVISAIVDKWPTGKPSKQEGLLLILFTVLNKVRFRSNAPWTIKLVRVFAQSCSSPHEKVVIAMCSFWLRSEGQRVLTEGGKVILPLIVPELMDTVTSHWSTTARNSAKVALSICQKQDARLVQNIMRSPEIQSGSSSESPIFKKWVSIAREAQRNDRKLNLSSALMAISAQFVVRETATLVSTQQSPLPMGRQARCYSDRAVLVKPKIEPCHAQLL
jgi:hypothetical protein